MKNNQGGLSAVETILIFVIVSIIGGTGWHVWDANRKASGNLNPDTNTTEFKHNKTDKITEPVFTALPAGWTEYKAEGLRFGYPKEWGTLSGTPLSTADYRDNTKSMQGRLVVQISPKDNFSVVARKYGSTIAPTKDGKAWSVVAQNPAAVDGYKIGENYKTKDVKVNGGTAIDLSFVDEDCTLTRFLFSLNESYTEVSIPELCPVMDGDRLRLSEANKAAYSKLVSEFIKTITLY